MSVSSFTTNADVNVYHSQSYVTGTDNSHLYTTAPPTSSSSIHEFISHHNERNLNLSNHTHHHEDVNSESLRNILQYENPLSSDSENSTGKNDDHRALEAAFFDQLAANQNMDLHIGSMETTIPAPPKPDPKPIGKSSAASTSSQDK
jgi:hypothetical protein